MNGLILTLAQSVVHLWQSVCLHVQMSAIPWQCQSCRCHHVNRKYFGVVMLLNLP